MKRNADTKWERERAHTKHVVNEKKTACKGSNMNMREHFSGWMVLNGLAYTGNIYTIVHIANRIKQHFIQLLHYNSRCPVSCYVFRWRKKSAVQQGRLYTQRNKRFIFIAYTLRSLFAESICMWNTIARESLAHPLFRVCMCISFGAKSIDLNFVNFAHTHVLNSSLPFFMVYFVPALRSYHH